MGWGWVFFKYWMFMLTNHHKKYQNKLMNGSWEIAVTNEQPKEQMDRWKDAQMNGRTWIYRTLLLKQGSNKEKAWNNAAKSLVKKPDFQQKPENFHSCYWYTPGLQKKLNQQKFGEILTFWPPKSWSKCVTTISFIYQFRQTMAKISHAKN